MFRDECVIEVTGGRGGDGVISFHREKFVQRGGPDGGDGGDGGDVVFVASPHVNSLLAIGRAHKYQAEGGEQGGPKKCFGKSGADVEIEVPVGTQIFDARRDNLLRDLTEPGQRLVIARGGRGGRGNPHFANAVRQAPRIAEPGTAGEQRLVRLELKLLAEIGLVGLPNAGKSTFLACVSQARPKIADYPFTTLVPGVGVAPVGDADSLVIADLPGLIEGASDGVGLGLQFLRHVERCPLLFQLVDVSPEAAQAPLAAFQVIDAELAQYSPELAARPRWIVATKCESAPAEARAAELEQALGRKVWRIAAVRGVGLRELLGAALAEVRAWRRLRFPGAQEPVRHAPLSVPPHRL
ncbi:MAG: GTPase ObgE [Planctomycetes bacterium]|nr:GTPase ObgE [Planctomycetota bacterium]